MAEGRFPQVNDALADVIEAVGHEPIAELEGYLGPGADGVLRLHPDFDPSRYLEISTDDVLSSFEIPDERGGRVRIVLRSDARVRSVSVGPAARAGLQQIDDDQLEEVCEDLSFVQGLVERLIFDLLEDVDPDEELIGELREIGNRIASIRGKYCRRPR